MSIPCFYFAKAILVEYKEKLFKNENYTEDDFFGLRWRWDIRSGEIKNLNSFCPACDYQILPKSRAVNINFNSFVGGILNVNMNICVMNAGILFLQMLMIYKRLKEKLY
jgi:hypothetical protein